jgi:hypothetical protein
LVGTVDDDFRISRSLTRGIVFVPASASTEIAQPNLPGGARLVASGVDAFAEIAATVCRKLANAYGRALRLPLRSLLVF